MITREDTYSAVFSRYCSVRTVLVARVFLRCSRPEHTTLGVVVSLPADESEAKRYRDFGRELGFRFLEPGGGADAAARTEGEALAGH